MRILFCSTPGQGHVRPLLPLWQALHRRGHALAWAGAAETRDTVEAAASARQWFDVGPGRQAALEALAALWPDAADALGTQQAMLFPRYFGGVLAPAMLGGLRQAVQSFSPDLLIGEAAALAVPLAAHLAGCAHVTHGIGLPPTPQQLAAAAEAFGPSWHAEAGRAPPRDAGLHRHLYLDIYPRSLQPATLLQPMPRLTLRPGDASPPPPAAPDAPPPTVVYLSLGNPLRRTTLWCDAVTALAALPVRLVVQAGPLVDPTGLGPLPPNVHLEHQPSPAGLPLHCRLVVSSGRSDTVLDACARGVPQLVLPQRAEHLANATALQRSGGGLAIPVEAMQTPFAIREAATRLLEEPRFTEIARGLAGEIARMPDATTTAVTLESMAGRFARQAAG